MCVCVGAVHQTSTRNVTFFWKCEVKVVFSCSCVEVMSVLILKVKFHSVLLLKYISVSTGAADLAVY